MNIYKAVLISDIHYNIHTLPLADAALRQAINKANEFNVPLIIAGDLHDTKANMRAECMNAMLKTFNKCNTACYILRGNHDVINEKSHEHSLNFLANTNIFIIDQPRNATELEFESELYLIPYEHNLNDLRVYIKTISKGATLIMHQGITGSNSGEYIQDKSALTKEDVKDFRVISGHYHTRQTIKTGRLKVEGDLTGTWDYIGNPYTLGWGESNDPEKGFQILMHDGSLKFVPTNLRKHVVINAIHKPMLHLGTKNGKLPTINQDDLVWLKLEGLKSEINRFDKKTLAAVFQIPNDFKLDLIPIDINTKYDRKTQELTQVQLLDDLIDHKSISKQEKELLKKIWKNL